ARADRVRIAPGCARYLRGLCGSWRSGCEWPRASSRHGFGVRPREGCGAARQPAVTAPAQDLRAKILRLCSRSGRGAAIAIARRMRFFLFPATLLLLAAGAAAASNRSCLACHTSPLFDAQAFAGSVHAKLECADCHRGFNFDLHRAAPPPPSAAEKAIAEKIGAKSTAPAAIAACGRCHESQMSDWTASVHGQWVREKRPAAGPTCLDCHGSAH